MSKCSNCGQEFKNGIGHVKVADVKCKERKFHDPHEPGKKA